MRYMRWPNLIFHARDVKIVKRIKRNFYKIFTHNKRTRSISIPCVSASYILDIFASIKGMFQSLKQFCFLSIEFELQRYTFLYFNYLRQYFLYEDPNDRFDQAKCRGNDMAKKCAYRVILRASFAGTV